MFAVEVVSFLCMNFCKSIHFANHIVEFLKIKLFQGEKLAIYDIFNYSFNYISIQLYVKFSDERRIDKPIQNTTYRVLFYLKISASFFVDEKFSSKLYLE